MNKTLIKKKESAGNSEYIREFTDREIEKLTEWFISKVKNIKQSIEEQWTAGNTIIIGEHSVGFRIYKTSKLNNDKRL